MERVTRYLVGLGVGGVGVILIDRADLGLLPFEAFFDGVAATTGLHVTWIRYLALGAMVAALRFSVARPDRRTMAVVVVWSTILGVQDALMPTLPGPSIAGAALGTVLLGVGVGVYLTADLGCGPTDLLPQVIAHRCGWGPGGSRVAMDLTVSALAVVLGGSLGIATLLVSVAAGPIVAATLRAVEAADRARSRSAGADGLEVLAGLAA